MRESAAKRAWASGSTTVGSSLPRSSTCVVSIGPRSSDSTTWARRTSQSKSPLPTTRLQCEHVPETTASSGAPQPGHARMLARAGGRERASLRRLSVQCSFV